MRYFYYRPLHKTAKLFVKFMSFPEPKLLKGPGAVEGIPYELEQLGINGPLLIATDKVLLELGLLKSLTASLEKSGFAYTFFDGVKPDPTTERIEEAVTKYVSEDCQAIIAFGGGSAIDLSKAVAARAQNPTQTLKDMSGYFKVKHPPAPLIAIPTTAGTGSEVTVAAVITDSSTHVKHLINDFKLVPKVAVLDPELMMGLPPSITATTGMDALTHAIEAYIGVAGNKKTRQDAVTSVKMVVNDLEKVYADGSNVALRENLAMASFLGGRACTKAYIGNVHALAHAIGGIYGIPHGMANAVLLPEVLEFYGKSVYKPLSELAVASNLGRPEEGRELLALKFIEKIRTMNATMGMPKVFDQLVRKDFEEICRRANKEANPYYPVPRIMGKKDFIKVLEKVCGDC